MIEIPGFDYGIKRAVSEIIGGAIGSVLVRTFIEIAKFSPEIIYWIKTLNFVSTLMLIYVMPYWGTAYMMGWILGIIILSNTELLSGLELLIYLGSGILVLLMRLSRKTFYYLISSSTHDTPGRSCTLPEDPFPELSISQS